MTDKSDDNKRMKWSELFPNGRTIFYEGDDPQGFREQIKAEFGFDPGPHPDEVFAARPNTWTPSTETTGFRWALS